MASETGSKVPKLFQNQQKLATHVGFPNVEALKTWMDSELVQPHWQHYRENHLDKRASGLGSAAMKGPEFKHVVTTLLSGEAAGKQKFSAHNPDTTKWTALEWQAHLLHKLSYHNTQNSRGPFYGRNLNSVEKYERLHQVIKRLTFDLAPARKSKTTQAGEAGTSTSTIMAPDLLEDDEDTSTLVPVGKKGGQIHMRWLEQDVPERILSDEAVEIEGIIVFDQVIATYAEIDTLARAVEERFQLRDKGLEVAGILDTHGDFLNEDSYNHFLREVSQAKMGVWANFIVRDLPPKAHLEQPHGTNLPPLSDEPPTGSRALDPFRLMCEERGFAAENDTSSRYWRWRILRETACMYDPNAGGDVRIGGEVDNATFDANLQYYKDLHDEAAEANAEEIEESAPPSTFPEITAEQEAKFKTMEKFLDNEALQRENTDAACKLLKITNRDMPQVDGLSAATTLRFWQPVAAAGLVEMEDNPVVEDMRSTMLCDGVGLGKTTVMATVLLHRYAERQSIEDVATRIARFGPPKPTLYVTLANLVPQVVSELREKAPGLIVKVYYDGVPQLKADRELHIASILTKDHPIFDEDEEDSARVVVVSSYGVIRTRHGPAKLKKARKREYQQQGHNASEADGKASDLFSTLSTDWEGSLDGKFVRLVCDESHEIGNDQSQGWIALRWLHTKYKTLLTATPLAPSVEAFSGQLHLMEGASAWSTPNLARLGVDRNFDPWTERDDHPAAELRYTSRSFDEHIDNNQRLDDSQKGHRLRELMKRIVIKRTAGSRIPFKNGRVIGEDIPAVQYTVVNCQFGPSEPEKYKALVEQTFNKGAMKNLRENPNALWTPAFRRMLLLCASLKFEYLLDLRVSELKQLRAQGITAHSLLQKCSDQMEKQGATPSFTMPEAGDAVNILKEHARDSPKLRYLMFIVAELVVLKQEKMTVWCSLPGTQQWLESVLREAGVKATSYRADMNVKTKTELQDSFNDTDDIEVLILPFKGAACGLNLQKDCRNMVFFDPGPNNELEEQAAGRHKRVGQTKPMRCIRLYLADGWDSRQKDLLVQKSLVGLMTQLNMEVLGDKIDEEGMMKNLVLHEGVIKPCEHPSVRGLQLPGITTDEFLVHLKSVLLGEMPVITISNAMKDENRELPIEILPDAPDSERSTEAREPPTKKVNTGDRGQNDINVYKGLADEFLSTDNPASDERKIAILDKFLKNFRLKDNPTADAIRNARAYVRFVRLPEVARQGFRSDDINIKGRARALSTIWSAALMDKE